MLITLEGIEGSGKTTQIKYIVEFLNRLGHETLATREPGGTQICKKIRKILLDPDNYDLCPEAELMLYCADRAQHIKSLIIPALASGKIVICDRFMDATTAYQGYARGISLDMIDSLHKIILKGLRPDLTFLLDLEPEISLPRALKQLNNGQRTTAEAKFEQEDLLFHRKVRDAYLKLALKEPDRFRIIDASLDETEVRNNIINILKSGF